MRATDRDLQIYEEAYDELSSLNWAYATSTKASQSSQQKAYEKFCAAFGHLPVTGGTGVPTKILCHYAIWLAASGVRSVRNYISMGPRILCENANLPFQEVSKRPKLKRTLKALDRIYGVKIKRKSPVTVDMLRRIRAHLNLDTLADATMWASILVAFFAFLRKANYTVTNESSFDVEDDLTLSKLIRKQGRYGLRLTKTKTVQFGERDVVIWLPKLNNSLCPQRAVDNMIKLRQSLSPDAPLFTPREGKALTKRYFSTRFKALLKLAGEDTTIVTPHSLRRGGATFALECGVPPICIKLQGDWASDAWLLYAVLTDNLKEKTLRKFEKAFEAPQ